MIDFIEDILNENRKFYVNEYKQVIEASLKHINAIQMNLNMKKPQYLMKRIFKKAPDAKTLH